MPVKICSGSGKKWGNHGKCYKGVGARQKAIKQMKAAYANGYRG